MVFDGRVIWSENLKDDFGHLRWFWTKPRVKTDSGDFLEWFVVIENVGLCLVRD